MQKESRTLHLFTAEFPNGNKSETFLETEILFLSKEFDKVIIYPSVKKGDTVRNVPNNVYINSILRNRTFNKKEKIILLLKKSGTSRKIIFSEIKDKGLKQVFKGRKQLLDYLSQQMLRSVILEKELMFEKNASYYDYWFLNSLLALTILKKKGLINKINARGHRFDIYDDCHKGIGVPFRSWTMDNISALFLISQNGLDYVASKVSHKNRSKLCLSRLGVAKNQGDSLQKKYDKKLILSCSSIIDFKQVHMIPQLLKEISLNIHWVHFGDGVELNKVKKALSDIPVNFTYELKGHVDNSEVIKFYQNNLIDLFISTSSSEGLPVSMMEAQSFGIPIVAFPVGGIPEIVKDGETGFLLNENNANSTNVALVLKSLEMNFSKESIVGFFNTNFDANKNYKDFVKLIK